jgi:hypothetical protein
MKTKRQHVQRHILTSLSLMLTLLLVAPGVTPAATAGGVTPVRDMTRFDQPNAAGTVPAGLTAGDQATMRDLIREAEYQFIWQVSGGVWAYRAPNRAHDLSLSLAADGFHAARTSAAGEPLWDVSLSLVAYGEQAVPAAIAGDGLNGSRERVEYHWSRDVVEWYVNRADGIEHGVTLAAPPAGAGDSTVELTFALGGSLTPELDPSGRGLRLKDASSQTALFYDQLAVYDATGRSLPSHMRLTEGRQTAELQLVIDTAGAAYPLIVDPLLHGEVAKLTASDAEDEDLFGFSVAISGDTVVAGAPWEGGAGYKRGAAYVFERNQDGADSWGQVTKLTASDAEDEDIFGDSVAISGDTVVVGATVEDGGGTDRGAAYVFERNRYGADSWGQVKKMTASDAEDGDRFGSSVSISGDTIVVGAYLEDGAGSRRGAAYLFARNQGGADNWGQVTKLTASDAEDDDNFGFSVAISGDTVVVGAYSEDGAGTERGAAYVFARNQGGADNWGQVQKLTASDAADPHYFGYSVAISGDTIVVGAYLDDGAGTHRGAAYVFERNRGGADNWGQVTKLTASDAEDNDVFGTSVAISGDTVAVGAWSEDGEGAERGAAYLFARNEGGADSWGQVAKLTASDAEDGDRFGRSVAINGNTVVAGAFWEDGMGNNRGAAYLFVAAGGQWQEVAIPRAYDAEDEDYLGFAVAISGDTVVVGAYQEDGAGSDRGAAYLIERNQEGADNWGQVKKLTAMDGQDDDYFGYSVAISGDTVVVGAYGEDGGGTNQGAAYIFARNHNPADPSTPLADYWGQVKKLTALVPGNSHWFGYSVAISGDTVVVGAPGTNEGGNLRGAAYVFARNQGGMDNWGLVEKLTASDAADGDYFGRSVGISGDTVVVGAIYEDGAGSARGAAYIFARNEGGADNWGQVRKLTASDAEDNDFFGRSVAISGDILVVGADGEDGAGSDRGAAYLFARNQGGMDNWGQVRKLTASDAEDDDYFGISVSISGDTLVVGAHEEDGTGSDRGAAYLFARNQGGGDIWGQVTKLTASDATDDDWFGRSVSISGDTAVIGAYGQDGAGSDRGAAYVFCVLPLEHTIYLPMVIKNN